MKLYITPGSPYARIARIVVLEKGLRDRVEVTAATTRSANSPYYAINPSGRVPYLVRDDGVGLEESAVICAWLDCSALALPCPAGQFFLDRARVGLNSGETFGAQYAAFARLNFATPAPVLREIVGRMAAAVRQR